MDLEALACARAKEQLDAGAWRSRDHGEGHSPRPGYCLVPGCVNPVPLRAEGSGRNREICDPCREARMSAKACKGCRGPLRQADLSRERLGRKAGYCRTCREAT